MGASQKDLVLNVFPYETVNENSTVSFLICFGFNLENFIMSAAL